MTEEPEASVLTARRAAQHVRLSSPDTARALNNAPLGKRRRSLIQKETRPTRYWLAADSHGDGNNPTNVPEAAPTACAVIICFASYIGSINGLEGEHRRKVCSVSG